MFVDIHIVGTVVLHFSEVSESGVVVLSPQRRGGGKVQHVVGIGATQALGDVVSLLEHRSGIGELTRVVVVGTLGIIGVHDVTHTLVNLSLVVLEEVLVFHALHQ